MVSDQMSLRLLQFVGFSEAERHRHSLGFPSVCRPFLPRVFKSGNNWNTPTRQTQNFAACQQFQRLCRLDRLLPGDRCRARERTRDVRHTWSRWKLHLKLQLFKSVACCHRRVHKYIKVETPQAVDSSSVTGCYHRWWLTATSIEMPFAVSQRGGKTRCKVPFKWEPLEECWRRMTGEKAKGGRVKKKGKSEMMRRQKCCHSPPGKGKFWKAHLRANALLIGRGMCNSDSINVCSPPSQRLHSRRSVGEGEVLGWGEAESHCRALHIQNGC